MDGKTTKSRWLPINALLGACGFGLELGRAAIYYKRPKPNDDFALIFILGITFLAMAVLNSIRLISQVRDLQDMAKK